jgi:DNA primase
MKKASEYAHHAQECRDLASKMALGEHRDQLLQLAAHWDRLAQERLQLLQRHPEMARPEAPEAAPPPPA